MSPRSRTLRVQPALLAVFAAGLFGQTSVLMNRYDAATTGANLRETVLTPASIKASWSASKYKVLDQTEPSHQQIIFLLP